MDIKIIRSSRKTISLAVTPDGIVVRAPKYMPKRGIDAFLREHRDWIDKHIALAEAQQATADQAGILTEEELNALAGRAKAYIPGRVAHYAPLIGVQYGRITIRAQKTKWGSCSSKGNLNFNCLLMLAPPEVLDSVVVHELCHRKEMNHSDRFYAEVERVFPDYAKWNRWLRENGSVLMLRLPK